MISKMKVELDLLDSVLRDITSQYLSNCLIVLKQYMSKEQREAYVTVLSDMSSLTEMENFEEKFNRAWPQDILLD